MSDTFKLWFRWVVLLPACILFSIFYLFILHWGLYFTLRNFIEPVPELPERLLTPFVASCAFIYGAYSFAPNFKLKSSYIIGALWLLGVFAFVIVAWSGGTYYGNELQLKNKGLQTLMAASGVFVAWFINNKKHKNEKL